MIELSQFEKYNEKGLGKLYLTLPGIITKKSSHNLNKLLTERDVQIILLTFNVDDDVDTFLELCLKLTKEGFQVVIEYNEYIFEQMIIRDLNYVPIIPNIDIVSLIKENLEKEYEESKDYFLEYYFDLSTTKQIIHKLMKNSKYCLELMSPIYNIRQAISEYVYMREEKYKYI